MNFKPTVVIIEDEKNICNFMETTLSAHNYKVIAASTGHEIGRASCRERV